MPSYLLGLVSVSNKNFNSQTRPISEIHGVKPNKLGLDVTTEEIVHNTTIVCVSREYLGIKDKKINNQRAGKIKLKISKNKLKISKYVIKAVNCCV